MGRYDGPTVDNMKVIYDKAKAKRDGVYTCRGILYRVRAGNVTHYFYYNELYQVWGNFVVLLGNTPQHLGRKALEKLP